MSSFFATLREDSSAEVTLLLGTESYALRPSEYAGKNVSTLFAEYGHRVGLIDSARVNTYQIAAGPGEAPVERSGSTVVRPGEMVRAIVSNEKLG